MRSCWSVFVLAAVLAAVARPAAAQGGGGGLGLVWVQPVGTFARTADPTVGISMWMAIGPRQACWAVRGEFPLVEEHLVADDLPDPDFGPAPGITTPLTMSLYTDIVGVTFGPMLMGRLGQVPTTAWLALGVDEATDHWRGTEGSANLLRFTVAYGARFFTGR